MVVGVAEGVAVGVGGCAILPEGNGRTALLQV